MPATLRTGTRAMRILVPVDGSGAANRAVAYALSLVGDAPEAGIVLVNVQSRQTVDMSDVSGVMTVDADRRTAARQAQQALRQASDLCREAGVRFDSLVELGPVAQTVARLARELEIGQIVMGTRGLGSFRGLVLGSIAAEVTRLAEVPVTLVK